MHEVEIRFRAANGMRALAKCTRVLTVSRLQERERVRGSRIPVELVRSDHYCLKLCLHRKAPLRVD